MKQLIYLLIILLGMLSACTPKEEPEDFTGTPLFSLNGVSNGVPFSFSLGGEKGFYLLTGYETDSNNTLLFWGKMKSTCSSCQEALRISIGNYTSGSNFQIDSVLKTGKYSYQGLGNTPYVIQFISQADSSPVAPVQHFWDFGDGSFSRVANPLKTFSQPAIHTVSYQAIYPGNYSSVLQQNINLTPEVQADHVSFSSSYNSPLELRFRVQQKDSSGTYFWNFGDSTGFTAVNGTSINHAYSTPGIYQVCVRKTVNGKPMEYCRNIAVPANSLASKANYTYTIEALSKPESRSTIVVEWTDAQGKTFSSLLAEQNTLSQFRVLAVSEFAPNALGQKTRIYKLRFTCMLSDGFQQMELKDVEGYMAIAYP